MERRKCRHNYDKLEIAISRRQPVGGGDCTGLKRTQTNIPGQLPVNRGGRFGKKGELGPGIFRLQRWLLCTASLSLTWRRLIASDLSATSDFCQEVSASKFFMGQLIRLLKLLGEYSYSCEKNLSPGGGEPKPDLSFNCHEFDKSYGC